MPQRTASDPAAVAAAVAEARREALAEVGATLVAHAFAAEGVTDPSEILEVAGGWQRFVTGGGEIDRAAVRRIVARAGTIGRPPAANDELDTVDDGDIRAKYAAHRQRAHDRLFGRMQLSASYRRV